MKIFDISSDAIKHLLGALDMDAKNLGLSSFPTPSDVDQKWALAYEEKSREALLLELSRHLNVKLVMENTSLDELVADLGEDPIQFLMEANEQCALQEMSMS